MLRRWLLVLGALMFAVAPVAVGQGAYPTRRDTYLNDYAALLTSADADAVRSMLTDLKAAYGIEAVVVTIDSIGDYETGDPTIEAFATGWFNAWGIGDATKNNGVLLLVAVKDRKVRVELGTGYGSGPSQEMQAVIDRYVLPKFRTNNYSGGIRLGTQALIAKLTDQPMPESVDEPPTRVPLASSASRPATRTETSSGLEGLIVLTIGLGVVVTLARLFGGAASSDSGNTSDDENDHSSWSERTHRSSWTSSSRSSSSSSSSSSRSSSSSSKGGGKSSGGGASGSW